MFTEDQRTELVSMTKDAIVERLLVMPQIPYFYHLGNCGCMVNDWGEGYLDVYIPETGCDDRGCALHQVLTIYRELEPRDGEYESDFLLDLEKIGELFAEREDA